MAIPISVSAPAPNASPTRYTLPAASHASVGSETPAHPGCKTSGAASVHDVPPSKDAYAAMKKSYVGGFVNRFDDPTTFDGSSGFTIIADSLRALAVLASN